MKLFFASSDSNTCSTIIRHHSLLIGCHPAQRHPRLLPLLTPSQNLKLIFQTQIPHLILSAPLLCPASWLGEPRNQNPPHQKNRWEAWSHLLEKYKLNLFHISL